LNGCAAAREEADDFLPRARERAAEHREQRTGSDKDSLEETLVGDGGIRVAELALEVTVLVAVEMVELGHRRELGH
jgi:hypothetical protein